MLTSSSQGTLGSGFINILVIPSDIKIFSISCDFYYLLFSLFFQVQRLGDCQVFSLWAGDNLSHIPGFSFKTCLSQATASWPPNPKAFFSPYLLLLSLICGLVDCAFPKPSCGLRDVTLSCFLSPRWGWLSSWFAPSPSPVCPWHVLGPPGSVLCPLQNCRRGRVEIRS